MLPFRTRLRAYLGTNLLPLLESQMTSMLTLLQGLVAQKNEADAAQQASFLNLHNALTRQGEAIQRLETLVREGQVTDEVQAVANELSTGLADIKKAAETADNGFEPVEEPTEGETPVVTEPTTDPVSPEVPADETPTVPVEGQPVTDEDPTSRKR